MPGITVEQFKRDGLFVKNKSRILSSLVGESMIWFSPRSLSKVRKLALTTFLYWCPVREQDNSSTRQLIDMVFGDNSSTQLKTTYRHFLKTIHRHIIILQLYPS